MAKRRLSRLHPGAIDAVACKMPKNAGHGDFFIRAPGVHLLPRKTVAIVKTYQIVSIRLIATAEMNIGNVRFFVGHFELWRL